MTTTTKRPKELQTRQIVVTYLTIAALASTACLSGVLAAILASMKTAGIANSFAVGDLLAASSQQVLTAGVLVALSLTTLSAAVVITVGGYITGRRK